MKLWKKDNTSTSELIETFTVGNDRNFDLLLAKFDVEGSIAHVTMLGEQGLMSKADANKAIEGLKKIHALILSGAFSIAENMEDVHSQIEWMLTNDIGEAGKMIHTGRSRNDQVAVDIKLYLRAAILEIKEEVIKLFNLLIEKSNQHKDVLIPGYTHLQIAMPSSIGLWLGAYAESLVDDMEFLSAAFHVSNKNPLGSGAGYGSSFPLNRKRTTELLKFQSLNYNAVYAQMSRGKTEKLVATALASIASTLSKLAMDNCLYVNQNFGFISFPEELTTGSSIMPHKKNPDVFELIRSHCNRLKALPNEIMMMTTNLPSGYHRDLQLLKEHLFPAFQQLQDIIQLLQQMISQIKITENLLQDKKYEHLFSVEAVNALVLQGVPFRDAYRQVGAAIENGTYQAPTQLNHTHEGSIGNLCTAAIAAQMNEVMQRFPFDRVTMATNNLLA